MPSRPPVLDEARELLRGRLAELDEERKRLERALKELGGKATRRSPGRPRSGKAATATTTPRKRRKRRAGGRAEQAVKLIAKSPGISAAEIAKSLKLKPNYLYRVLGDLEKEGQVKKDGRQYYPSS